jgi:hypothetical protein
MFKAAGRNWRTEVTPPHPENAPKGEVMREIEEVRKIVSEAQIKRDAALAVAKKTYDSTVADIHAEYEASIKGARELMTELQGIFGTNGTSANTKASKKTKKSGSSSNTQARSPKYSYKNHGNPEFSDSLDADLVAAK